MSTRTFVTLSVVLLLVLAFAALLMPAWMAALDILGISPYENLLPRFFGTT